MPVDVISRDTVLMKVRSRMHDKKAWDESKVTLTVQQSHARTGPRAHMRMVQ